jgi:hypothetical protein
VYTGSVAQPASYKCVEAFFPGVKWPRPEVDHSPSFNAEVKNEWICTSAFPIYSRNMEKDFIFYIFEVQLVNLVIIIYYWGFNFH